MKITKPRILMVVLTFFISIFIYDYQNKTRVILGIGSGRCGTLALSKLLNSQKSLKVTHEYNECTDFHWNDAESKMGYLYAENRYQRYKSWTNKKITGGIPLGGFLFVPRTSFIINQF